MWFKLVNANFTTNLGTMSSLSNSWGVTWSVSGGIVKTSCPGSVTKGGTLNATLTLNSGASLTSITSSSGTLTKTVSGTTVTVTVTGISANCTITVVATGGTSTPVNPPASGNGVWLSELVTGSSNAHNEFMAVASHTSALSNSAEYIYHTEAIKTLLEGKKITQVACPNLGAGNTVTFYSNPWSASGTLTKTGRSELFTITGASGESTGGSNMTTYNVSNPVAVKSGESVAFAVSSGVKMVDYDLLSYVTPIKYAYGTDNYTSVLDKFVNFDFYLEG